MLESKISDVNTPDLDKPKILTHYEDTTPYYNAWSESGSTIEVSQPTFAFTKKFLEDANWKIESWFDLIEDIPGIPNMRPDMKMQRYGFFCTR